MSPVRGDARWIRTLGLNRRAAPGVLALMILLLTLLTAYSLSELATAQQRARFEGEAQQVSSRIENTLSGYLDVMITARALLQRGDVSREAFAEYVSALQVTQLYRTVQGLGFAQAVTPDTLAAYIAANADAEGFAFRPPGRRPLYLPVTYLEPATPANVYARGFDMYAEPIRREAIERAITTGQPSATRAVRLVQEDVLDRQQAGFLVYLAVYGGGGVPPAAERRERFLGAVYAPFRVEDLFTESLPVRGGLSLQVSQNGTVLYGEALAGAPFRYTQPLRMGGTDWTLEFTAPASYGRDSGANLPFVMALLGALVAALAYLFTATLLRAQRDAEAASDDLLASRQKLLRSRAEFEAIFQAMGDGALFTDPAGRIKLANDTSGRLLGVPAQELLGLSPGRLHEDARLRGLSEFPPLSTRYRLGNAVLHGEGQRRLVMGRGGEVLGTLETIRDVSALQAAQQRLREGELRYRGVLEASGNLVVVIGPLQRDNTGGGLLYFNTAWYRYTGMGSEAIDAEAVLRIIHPHDRERMTELWQHASAGAEAVHTTCRLARADGEHRWFAVNVSPVIGPGGAVLEWVINATDIHELREARQAASDSEARYRQLLEVMPQLVILTDRQGAPLYLNERFRSYTGYHGPVGLGARLPGFVPPAERAAFQERWDSALERGELFMVQHRLTAGAGQAPRHFLTRGMPVEGGPGRQWVITSTDIEPQVRNQAAVQMLADVSRLLAGERSAEALAQALVHLTQTFSAAAVLQLASGQRFTAPNAERLPSARTVRLLERALAGETVHEPHARLHLLALPLALRGEAPLAALVLGFGQHPDARETELSHELAWRFATALDAMAQHRSSQQARADLETLNHTLEDRVRQRTHDLEIANQELEAFSYSVSHDLRAPLRHVLGFGDLLAKDRSSELSPKGQRYLGIMIDAATKLSALIDALLEFSRTSRQEVSKVPLDIAALVEGLWADLEPEHTERQVAFTLRREGLQEVPGDPALLRQVFFNLLMNALKYSATREHIHIAVWGERGEDEVTVHVRDNGVGFDPDYASRLFGVFQRLHSNEYEGTGIGLATVRRIVGRHGGRVWATGAPDEGATFSLTLPLDPPDPEERS